jgi:hypothetical protein
MWSGRKLEDAPRKPRPKEFRAELPTTISSHRAGLQKDVAAPTSGALSQSSNNLMEVVLSGNLHITASNYVG